MARRSILASVAILAMTVSACSRVGGPGTALETPTSAPTSTTEPTTASEAFVGEVRLEMVDDQLLVVSDAGIYRVERSDLAKLGPFPDSAPVRSGVTAFGGGRLGMATSDGGNVTLYVSDDSGTTWKAAGSTAIESPTGVVRLDLAGHGSSVSVIAEEASGSAFRFAFASSSTDGGATWETTRAPAGGALTFAGGAYWLIGGVMGDEVYRSTDAIDWKAVTIPVEEPYWPAGEIEEVEALGLVIPVSTHPIGAASTVVFMGTTDNGGTWRILTSVPAPPTDSSTSVPTMITPGGDWTVVYGDASKVISGRFGSDETTVRSPNGLPIGVLDIGGTSGGLVALTMPSSCPDGKASCTSTTQLVWSFDAGQTWNPIEARH